MSGTRGGAGGGDRNARVVVKVAVQNAVAVAVPAVGVHVTAAESGVVPLLNSTVPVGPAPWLVVATVAVRVTLPPELMLVAELTTVVVVGRVPEVPEANVKLKTVFPPRARGLGSAGPK